MTKTDEARYNDVMKEALTTPEAQVKSDNVRKGQEEMIKQALKVEDDIDLSKLSDEDVAKLAAGGMKAADPDLEGEDAEKAAVANTLGLEDKDALSNLSDEDIEKIEGSLGTMMDESLTVTDLLEYANTIGMSDHDLAVALKEHCSIKMQEAKEIIESRYETIPALDLDRICEVVSKLKEETIHDAYVDPFLDTEIEATGVVTGSNEEDMEQHPQDDLEDIKGEPLKEDSNVKGALRGIMGDIHAAQRDNEDLDIPAVAKDLQRAENKTEMAMMMSEKENG